MDKPVHGYGRCVHRNPCLGFKNITTARQDIKAPHPWKHADSARISDKYDSACTALCFCEETASGWFREETYLLQSKSEADSFLHQKVQRSFFADKHFFPAPRWKRAEFPVSYHRKKQFRFLNSGSISAQWVQIGKKEKAGKADISFRLQWRAKLHSLR